MPIFEYKCQSCGHMFEELVFDDSVPQCPACKSSETEKLMSRCSCHLSAGGVPDTPSAPQSSGGGCSGCSGGHCATCCGH